MVTATEPKSSATKERFWLAEVAWAALSVGTIVLGSIGTNLGGQAAHNSVLLSATIAGITFVALFVELWTLVLYARRRPRRR